MSFCIRHAANGWVRRHRRDSHISRHASGSQTARMIKVSGRTTPVTAGINICSTAKISY